MGSSSATGALAAGSSAGGAESTFFSPAPSVCAKMIATAATNATAAIAARRALSQSRRCGAGSNVGGSSGCAAASATLSPLSAADSSSVS